MRRREADRERMERERRMAVERGADERAPKRPREEEDVGGDPGRFAVLLILTTPFSRILILILILSASYPHTHSHTLIVPCPHIVTVTHSCTAS